MERAGAAGAALAPGRGRLDGLTARLEEDEARGIARAARHGGRRVDDELVVDPALRAAVEAALGELVRAYVLPRAEVGAIADERGASWSRSREPSRIPETRLRSTPCARQAAARWRTPSAGTPVRS